MSSFYTVNTTNAFAALDLSDDGERILPSSAAPQPKVEEPVPPQRTKEIPQEAPPGRGRGGGRGGRGGRGAGNEGGLYGRDTNNNPGGRGRGRGGPPPAPTSPASPQDFSPVEEDSGFERFSRRGGMNAPFARRGGRNDPYPAREGKKNFDRKTNPAQMRKPEDTNPVSEVQDEEAADVMAAEEDLRMTTPVTEEVEEVKEPQTISVANYFASIQSDRIAVPEVEVVPEYTDLNREIADAGFKPIQREEDSNQAKIPGGLKSNMKSSQVRAAQDLFTAVGGFASIRPDRGARGGGRGGRMNDRPARPQENNGAPNSPVLAATDSKKRLLKDDAEYPTLC